MDIHLQVTPSPASTNSLERQESTQRLFLSNLLAKHDVQTTSRQVLVVILKFGIMQSLQPVGHA